MNKPLADQTPPLASPTSLAGPPVPRLLSSSLNVARSSWGGVRSVFKTRVLGIGRVSDKVYAQRLSVCKGCPGGHAKFDKDGNLKTCGPMLKSMAAAAKDGGPKPCGCVLKHKARDAQQACPMGYWPTVKRTDIVAEPTTNTPKRGGKLVLPGDPAWPLSRRGLLRGGVGLGGAAAAASVLGPKIAKAETGDACWIKAKKCTDCSDYKIKCVSVQGKRRGERFKDSNGDCFYLDSHKPEKLDTITNTVGVDTWEECKCDCAVIKLSPCNGGDPIYSKDSMATTPGTTCLSEMKVVELTGAADQCYQVSTCSQDSGCPTPTSVTVNDELNTCGGCLGCNNPSECGACCFSEDATIDIDFKTNYLQFSFTDAQKNTGSCIWTKDYVSVTSHGDGPTTDPTCFTSNAPLNTFDRRVIIKKTSTSWQYTFAEAGTGANQGTFKHLSGNSRYFSGNHCYVFPPDELADTDDCCGFALNCCRYNISESPQDFMKQNWADITLKVKNNGCCDDGGGSSPCVAGDTDCSNGTCSQTEGP